MNSPSKDLKIVQAISLFRTEYDKGAKYVQQLADEADESGDYDDYDQACYDFWQSGNEAGLALAFEIEGIVIPKTVAARKERQ